MLDKLQAFCAFDGPDITTWGVLNFQWSGFEKITEKYSKNFVKSASRLPGRRFASASVLGLIENNLRNINGTSCFTVVGTLDAPHYAMFVSGDHEDGQVRTSECINATHASLKERR